MKEVCLGIVGRSVRGRRVDSVLEFLGGGGGNLYVKFRSPKFSKFVTMGMQISNFNNYVWKNVFFGPLKVRESY